MSFNIFTTCTRGLFESIRFRGKEKVIFLKPDIAETYAPVKITVAYGGQNPAPRPFIMVLLWIRTPEGWMMATDIPIPVPPDPTPR